MFKTPICIQSSFNHAKEEKKVASVQNKKPLKSQPNKSQQPRPYQPAKCRLNKDINLSKEESIEPRQNVPNPQVQPYLKDNFPTAETDKTFAADDVSDTQVQLPRAIWRKLEEKINKLMLMKDLDFNAQVSEESLVIYLNDLGFTPETIDLIEVINHFNLKAFTFLQLKHFLRDIFTDTKFDQVKQPKF